MKDARKAIREWLDGLNKQQFTEIIDNAKLSPRQVEIANMKFLKYRFNYQIGMDMCLSEETVKKELTKIYDKLTKQCLI